MREIAIKEKGKITITRQGSIVVSIAEFYSDT